MIKEEKNKRERKKIFSCLLLHDRLVHFPWRSFRGKVRRKNGGDGSFYRSHRKSMNKNKISREFSTSKGGLCRSYRSQSCVKGKQEKWKGNLGRYRTLFFNTVFGDWFN